MVKIPDKVIKTIENYISLLKENNIPINNLYLYGSYAKGNFKEYSDIDIALISEIFEGKRILDRKKIRKITLSLSSEIEVIPFNPKDFTNENPFAKEILETGIKIV